MARLDGAVLAEVLRQMHLPHLLPYHGVALDGLPPLDQEAVLLPHCRGPHADLSPRPAVRAGGARGHAPRRALQLPRELVILHPLRFGRAVPEVLGVDVVVTDLGPELLDMADCLGQACRACCATGTGCCSYTGRGGMASKSARELTKKSDAHSPACKLLRSGGWRRRPDIARAGSGDASRGIGRDEERNAQRVARGARLH